MHAAKTPLATFVVTEAENGQTLQALLARRLGVSRRAAKNLLDDRCIWVNRKLVWMAHHALRRGDTVQTSVHPMQAAPVRAQRIRVLVEDEHYLFVDKPAGIMTVGLGGLEERLREQMAAPQLRVVHRLDRDTSGCLMVARTGAAFDAAVSVFKMRRVLKVYQAICLGRIERRGRDRRLFASGTADAHPPARRVNIEGDQRPGKQGIHLR